MNDVIVTFVGTGDAFNTGTRANQAVWIQGCQHNLLLDCGPTTLLRLFQLGLDPNDLDMVCLTHFHWDHMGGITGVQLFRTHLAPRAHKLTYCGPVGLQNMLTRCFDMGYDGIAFASERCPVDFVELRPDEERALFAGAVQVKAVGMQHRPESLGYRISLDGRTIAITGDTQWHRGIPLLSAQADLLICECGWYDQGHPAHLSHAELVAHRHELTAKRLILTHMGAEVLAKLEQLSFEAAHDGMRVVL